MPASVTYTCDKTGVQATVEGQQPGALPDGWVRVMFNGTGTNAFAQLYFSPAAYDEFKAWYGKEVFPPPVLPTVPPVVPETEPPPA